MGYHRAGFEVVGVDIKPQPHYPFEFHQADALTYPLDGFDAYHASPPCQRFSTMKGMRFNKKHPDLLTPILLRFEELNCTWVIENVVGSPLRSHVQLCGSVFGLGSHGYQLRRHRWFQSNILIPVPPCNHKGRAISIINGPKIDRLSKRVPPSWGNEAMGINWMNREELSEAIPPDYTEYIGKYLIKFLNHSRGRSG
ncbi:hypothetical protein ES708_20909 [subsurface metagenome]